MIGYLKRASHFLYIKYFKELNISNKNLKNVEMDTYKLKELNNRLPNLKILYEILVDNKGYYLPKWESKSCTYSYLMKIVKDSTIFKVMRQNITKPPMIKQTKTIEDLLDIIGSILTKKGLSLGFDIDKRPDKEWVLNILYFLEPKNPVFFFEEESLERQFPKG